MQALSPRTGDPSWWWRLLPFLRWWPLLNRQTLRADAIAGLTGGLVLVPQGVAFATIAGMPPQYGLYAAMLPAIIAALWGSSWHLVSGPTTAISIVVFATMSPLAPPGSPEYVGLVLTLTLLVGVFQLLLGLLRMGTLVNFVSHTVVVGFTTGAAVLIASSQVRNFFGITVARGASVWEVLDALAHQLGAINPYITSVALLTVACSVLSRRWWPRFPHMIAGLLAGSLLAALLNHLFGVQRTGIGSIGALQIGLPPLSAPDLSIEAIRQITPIAMAVAVLALTEAVSISRAVALKSGQRIDGNQEFIGQGLSNLAAAFFSGYACSGSFNRSGLNYDAGARTPMAAILSAVFLLLVMLFLSPLAAYLPLPAMAGILFVVAWGLVDRAQIAEILRTSRAETGVLLATFVATLTLNLEYAIYIGVLLSLMLYLNRTSRPPLEDVKPADPQHILGFSTDTGLPDCPQLKMVRLNGSIYFGAVTHLQEALQAIDERNPAHRHVLLVASGINFVDLAGAHLLGQEARRRRALGGALYLFNLKNEPMEMLRRSGVADEIGEDNFFRLGDDVFGILVRRLNPDVCRNCTARIFHPCRRESA
ncbi:MAG: SulP family inorganic anion transporter [Rhodoferax sp.]